MKFLRYLIPVLISLAALLYSSAICVWFAIGSLKYWDRVKALENYRTLLHAPWESSLQDALKWTLASAGFGIIALIALGFFIWALIRLIKLGSPNKP